MGNISTVGTHEEDLAIKVANKCTVADSECCQIVGSLCRTVDLLQVELKDKQASLN